MTKLSAEFYEDYMKKLITIQDIGDYMQESFLSPAKKMKAYIKGINQLPNELTPTYLERLSYIRTELFSLSEKYEYKLKTGKAVFNGAQYNTKFFNYYDQDGRIRKSTTLLFHPQFSAKEFMSLLDSIINYKKTLLTVDTHIDEQKRA